MKIRRIIMERLTKRTCELNEATEGYGCNKTIFLLQEHMQIWNSDDTETWTIKNYERDRFGLINGLMYLIRVRNMRSIEVYFPKKEKSKSKYLRFDKKMSYTQISKIIDTLYDTTIVVYCSDKKQTTSGERR